MIYQLKGTYASHMQKPLFAFFFQFRLLHKGCSGASSPGLFWRRGSLDALDVLWMFCGLFSLAAHLCYCTLQPQNGRLARLSSNLLLNAVDGPPAGLRSGHIGSGCVQRAAGCCCLRTSRRRAFLAAGTKSPSSGPLCPRAPWHAPRSACSERNVWTSFLGECGLHHRLPGSAANPIPAGLVFSRACTASPRT